MLLTVDLGNSRCKVRRWEAGDGAARCVARAEWGDAQLERELEAWLRHNGPMREAFLSSVADAGLEERILGILRSCVPRVRVAPDPGLEVRCREPGRVGLDRLYAARGALGLLGSPALVVDLGTALTVDAVEDLPGAVGAFLGGAIAPGPALQARSLSQGAARLSAVEITPGAPALGRDTEGAIRAGIAVGLRGAARHLADEVARLAGHPEAPVVLTGGARRLLLEPQPFTERVLHEEPELVHLGLLLAGRAAEPAR